MKLVEWLAKEVTDDPRALRWFAEPDCDERIARAYRELLAGYQIDPGSILKTTRMLEPGERPGSVEVNEIAFYSICAHHFLPFFGAAHVAYMPGEHLIGLSKLARAVDHYARRPQLQENLTEEVAALLDERLAPSGLIVSIEARHLCMEMRGVSTPGATTTTMAVRGTFEDDRLQEQFFERLRRSGETASGRELRY